MMPADYKSLITRTICIFIKEKIMESIGMPRKLYCFFVYQQKISSLKTKITKLRENDKCFQAFKSGISNV